MFYKIIMKHVYEVIDDEIALREQLVASLMLNAKSAPDGVVKTDVVNKVNENQAELNCLKDLKKVLEKRMKVHFAL